MNTHRLILVLFFFNLQNHIVFGQSRASTDYAMAAETIDFGGQNVASADYAITGSISPITDISKYTPSEMVARSGYIGQIYERLGLGMIATDFYPPEESSTQFTVVHTNDDGTNDAISGALVTWEILGGPLTGIDASGLANTGIVYESSEAIVRGTVFSTPLQLSVYVQDSANDNFGGYSGDGIEDSWQIFHFGQDNPLAGPHLDPDGDGQNTQFEYLAGLDPTDQNSRFYLSIESISGENAQKRLRFGPVFNDRSYVVTSNSWLSGQWLSLTDPIDDEQSPERTVIDTHATEEEKFYRVEIRKP